MRTKICLDVIWLSCTGTAGAAGAAGGGASADSEASPVLERSLLYRLRPSSHAGPAAAGVSWLCSGCSNWVLPFGAPLALKSSIVPGTPKPSGTGPAALIAIVPSERWIESCRKSDTFTFLSWKKEHSTRRSRPHSPGPSEAYVCARGRGAGGLEREGRARWGG